MTHQDWNADLGLVRDVLRGSKSAVNTFVERCRCIPRIVGAKNARQGRPFSADEVNDLAQEVFSRVWARLDVYEGRASLESWIFRFCTLTMIDAMKARRRSLLSSEQEQEAAVEDSDGKGLSEPDKNRVYAAIETLDPSDAETIRLKQFEGQSFPEIAGFLGLPQSTIKTRYYRALTKLRARLAPSFGEATE